MDNGAVTGGWTPVLETFKNAASQTALWQLHFSNEGGTRDNTAAPRIANLTGTAQGPDAGYLIRVTVAPNREMQVWNSRTGKAQAYPAPR